MKYDFEASEVLFYVDILCSQHNITRKDIRQLVKLFNEVLELPIDYIELQEVIYNPKIYEEKRLLWKNLK
jgi:hypothetical protein